MLGLQDGYSLLFGYCSNGVSRGQGAKSFDSTRMLHLLAVLPSGYRIVAYPEQRHYSYSW